MFVKLLLNFIDTFITTLVLFHSLFTELVMLYTIQLCIVTYIIPV